MNAFKYKEIKLSDVVLYEDNPRFERSFSETESVHKIVENQGSKLVRLAEHIIEVRFLMGAQRDFS